MTEKTELLDGGPITDEHKELKANGQQKDYIVLTKEEREKGFIRPVRDTYQHVGERPKYALRDLNEEEKVRYEAYGYVKYEDYQGDSSLAGRFWTTDQLKSGCNTTTTMSKSIAETYARNPKFYGSTFCCKCSVHLTVDQFVWEGTNEVVGS